MDWGIRRRSVKWVPGLMLALALIGAPAAKADVVLKAGPSAETAVTHCAPSLVTPAYSQQTAGQGDTTGIEPKVGDVFYISLRIDLAAIFFDCAADFYSVLATLPANLTPAIGGSATTICRRWGINGGGSQVFDQRSQANCAASPAFNAGTRELNMRPVSSPVLPDVGGAGGGFWFAGIRSPQESQEYRHVQLLVPVKASAQITNQPIQFLVCSVGTNCVNASVNLTVTGAPAQSDPPQISLPGAAQVTAVGARLPFTVNDDPVGSSYYLKVDTATNPAFSSGRPCGLTGPVIYGAPGPAPFSGSIASEIQYGDLQSGGETCYLAPQTTYNVKVCTSNPLTAFPFTDFPGCRFTAFTTGSVNVTMELPGDPPFPVTPIAKVKVIAGHPAGTVNVQAKPWASSVWSSVSTPTVVSQSVNDSPVANHSVAGLNQWRTFHLRACFVAGGHQPCSTQVEYTTGHATTGDSSNVTHESATLSGTASSPNPALNLAVLLSTSDPAGTDPRASMELLGSGATASNGTTDPNPPATATVSGLQANTTYYWTACFNNPAAQPPLEDCGDVKSFTTPPAPGFCELNPGDPSCQPGFCETNPADPSCIPDPCDSSPKPPSCSPEPRPSLTIGKLGPVKVKRGKSARIRVPVKNVSSVPAANVKVCPSLARKFKRHLKLPRCRALGTLAADQSTTANLTVRAPRKARTGLLRVKVTLSWSGRSTTRVARVTVRR